MTINRFIVPIGTRRDHLIDLFINEKVIFVLITIVSATAIYISHTTGYMLAYNDATAHLNTARRIVDSLTPGLVQIGSVWLPLLHIFELPFVMNDYLWQTGLAGAIVSGGSFIIAGVFLYKLITLITKSRWAGLIGVLVYASNLNMLYLQTTAMFEPLLTATELGSIYYLTRWVMDEGILDLVKAAFFTMLATLTRYDGWALFVAESAFILFYSLILKKKRGEGAFVLFLCLASFGIFLWFVYNLLIFSDPLYFARSEFSAGAQQQILAQRGQLPTRHDLNLSFVTYSIAVILNVGILPTILMVVGVLAYLKSNLFKLRNWGPLLLTIPYFFNIISLYLGQSVIWLPMIPPFFATYFNARYGLLMLPAAAFFAGYLASKHLIFKLVVLVLISLQVYLFLHPSLLPLFGHQNGMITLQDTVSSVNSETRAASDFLHNNYDHGLILASSASEDAFIFRAGIPLKNYITEGSGHFWKQSLKDPRTFARWVVFFKDKTDRVGVAIGNSKIIKEDYKQVYGDNTYLIFVKK